MTAQTSCSSWSAAGMTRRAPLDQFGVHDEYFHHEFPNALRDNQQNLLAHCDQPVHNDPLSHMTYDAVSHNNSSSPTSAHSTMLEQGTLLLDITHLNSENKLEYISDCTCVW